MSSMCTNAYSSSEILFTISRSSASTSADVENPSLRIENEQYLNSEPDEVPDTVLCVLRKNSLLGAAYYNINSKQLYMMNDLIEEQPEFEYTRRLLNDLNLKHLITMGGMCDEFVKFLIDWLAHSEDVTVESDQIRKLPPNMSLLPFKEYTYPACEIKIFSLNLPSMPEEGNQTEKDIYFRSLVNFDNKMSTYALGALIKFTEQAWGHIFYDKQHNTALTFMHINQISVADHVFINRYTFKELQVFQKRNHDAKFKHGRASTSREGLSVYKLLSKHCQSRLGFGCLRRLLLNPTKNITELNKRLDFIQFASLPTNLGLVDSLQDTIKKIYDIDMIIGKIQHSRGTSSDWELLYKTICHTLSLHELCLPYGEVSSLLNELNSAVSNDLYGLEKCIRNALDFANGTQKTRPLIKYGLDEDLDKKKLRRPDIGKHLTAAADFTVNKLPEFLDECTVIYIPEMGHLLAVKKPLHNTNPDQMEPLGFQFMFEIQGIFHYRSPMCKELDKHLGQIHEEILAHENRIIDRLTGFILRFNKHIRQPLNIIAHIDCLISIAKVAKEGNYVRPTLNENNVIEIEEGRHMLLELYSTNYVPNDLRSGGDYSHMKLITGPNASGKSVFLKQSTLLVYLAHVGSYVPAKSANICILRSIHSRIHAAESAAVRLSAFMIDLTQMAKALHNSKPNSLVVIDEFGLGTAGADGMALLASALKSFLRRGESCPHVLVSTHYQEVAEHLPTTPLISDLRMDHTIDKDGNVVFLFKTIEGVSNSFGFDVALAAGLDKRIVDRAKEICSAMQNDTPIPFRSGEAETSRSRDFYSRDFFVNIDIPELDE